MNITASNQRAKQIVITWLAAIFLVLSMAVPAFSYSTVIAFGDSLSDNGQSATDQYGIQRYSNGPVWVEYLTDSNNLNVPLHDVAFGGATTGYDNPAVGQYYPSLMNTGLNSQVDYFLSLYSNLPGDLLITVWAGANDLFNSRSWDTAADNVKTAIEKLANHGAMNFLVPNLPDVGKSPAFSGTADEANATLWCQAFNGELDKNLADLRTAYPGRHFYALDTFTMLHTVMSNPAAYGIDNTTGTWQTRPDGDTSVYLFWDGGHPTTQAHAIIGDYAYAQVTQAAPVPVPASLLLLGSGLIGLACLRKRVSK